MERISNDPRYKEDSAFGGGENPIVTLKKEPFTIDKIVGSNYVDDNLVAIFFYLNGDATDILPSINRKKLYLSQGLDQAEMLEVTYKLMILVMVKEPKRKVLLTSMFCKLHIQY